MSGSVVTLMGRGRLPSARDLMTLKYLLDQGSRPKRVNGFVVVRLEDHSKKKERK